MEIEQMAKKIKEEGGTLYLVGGAVRDNLLKKECHDQDYVITGITEKQLEALFSGAKKQGKTFPVYEIEGKEFALARKERKIGAKHQDYAIDSNPHITIIEDLSRRDLTINSMAQEVLTGEIIDPYHGKEDVEKRLLRATSDAFYEDALRVYRTARFAATLGFSVEENTLKKIKKMKAELKELPKERVFEEFKRALASPKPSIFFEVLKQAEVLDVHFKEIQDLIGSEQPKEYHPEGDSYNHTLIVVDLAAEKTQDLLLRFCALVHDLGKGTTPKEMYPHHYGHDERGVDLVEALGKRIGTPKNWIACGKVAAKEHMRGGKFSKMSPKKQIDFIERVSKTALGLEGLQLVVDCDKNGRSSKENRFLEIGKECLTAVSGKVLKQEGCNLKGKEFAKKLHEERVKWLKEKREKNCI